MRPLKLTPCRTAGWLLAGTLAAIPAFAQTELPPLRTTTSSRPTLERPPVYNVPPSSRSTTSRRTTSAIPDPSIFDGANFPPEERPEQGLIAQFEMPGEQQRSTQNVEGDGQQQGGGGQGPGGDGQQSGGGGGPQMSVAGIPGLQIPGLMGGGGGEGDQQGMPALPTLDMGDRQHGTEQGEEGEQGGQGGEGGEPGEQGQAGAAGEPGQEAPQLAGREGRQLEKPGEVPIGDEGAKLAQANTPTDDPSRQTDGSAQGEDRMQVKSASGQQSGERGSGSERGIDIPSNL